ncbi:unnamed protein product [Durusdinium trenchii]|uniref:Uncharacterized protein n=1 Tax=Durusdinium trenchii TaxID=1381693 RepID=A0ABP0NYE1_9DINO
MFKFPQPSEEEKASPASVSPTRTATDAQGALAEHMPCPGLVTVLHHEQELDRILETLGSRWVVLELLASWSAACAAIRSDFEVLAKAYPTWIFLRADILQLPGLARRWSCTWEPLKTDPEEDLPAICRASATRPTTLRDRFRYFVVGSALSFLVGRRPGTLPEDLVGELAMPCVVLAFWVITYSLLDVMAVGQAKHKHNMVTKTYKDLPGTEPEEVYLAQRAQTNQVEQMASFFVSTLMFSVLVNGRIGGLLSLIYLVLRQFYAMTYRAAVGISIEDSGLTKYTIPCYFLLNGMAAAVVVHMTRYALTIA